MKTKPSQHSVKELLSIGIQPDIIVCRTEKEISKEAKEKLALFCNVDKDCVIQNIDCNSLYEVPLLLEQENLAKIVCRKLSIECKSPDLSDWCDVIEKQKNLQKTVTVALVGKYVELHDAYISIVESLKHAGIHTSTDVKIKWINAEEIEKSNAENLFLDVDAILIPGGFGERGVEGKISAVKYARENKIPLLAICLGMQCVVIEFARNVLGLKDAYTSEIRQTPNPVIDLMPEQKDIDALGGTMRLGAYPCKLAKGTFSIDAYGEELIYERHRHRYEFNNEYRNAMIEKGLIIAGVSPDEKLVEIVEISKDIHPWFVGVQFHPELKSRPNRPHPLFKDFIKATINKVYN